MRPPGKNLQPGDRLVLATHNAGKLKEFARLLAPLRLELSCAGHHSIPEPEETGATFADNAALKAQAVVAACGLPALADDSGLAIAALDGAPGVHSARWAGPSRDFNFAMEKIELALQGQGDRRASFVTVLALHWPDGSTNFYQGKANGMLVWPPRGHGGFGYDPIFMPAGCDKTFGEMTAEEKNRLSHRALACASLVQDFTEAD